MEYFVETRPVRQPAGGSLKKPFLAGCSKMSRCKAPEILRSEIL
jgi:hypothetical protein